VSIGTAIVIVGSMFFVLVGSTLVFSFVQWRKLERKNVAASEEFERTRESINSGARRTPHRFKP
jgi:hypothetical protein